MKINLTKILKKLEECEDAVWCELGDNMNSVFIKFYKDGSGSVETMNHVLFDFDNWEELEMFGDMPVKFMLKEFK